jgi:hypothetical protein
VVKRRNLCAAAGPQLGAQWTEDSVAGERVPDPLSETTNSGGKPKPALSRFAGALRRHPLSAPALSFVLLVLGTLRDLVPIIAVIAVFQLAVLQQPFPNLVEILIGLMFVMLGLALFVKGLEMGLFPLGEGLAQDFARKGSLFWLLLFSFALGFGTTVAEPALLAVAAEAARTAAESGVIEPDADAIDAFALGLRYTVAVSVGAGVTLGVLRILKGWPVHWLIIGGYLLAVAMSFFAPEEIIGIAFDLGGVTTSTITVPLLTALGVGLSSMIRGRNPLIDGFGLIAFACLTPILFVLVFGMLM